MSARPFAIALLLSAAASAVVLWDALAAVLAAGCAVSLLVGLTWRRTMPTIFAGCLLYAPLAVALTSILPGTWGYLASGLFIIVISERMTFEYDVSAVLESPTGVDARVRSLVSDVSRAHARKLLTYAALATIVIAASAFASYFTVYASELVAASVLLMLVVLVYKGR